MTKDCQNNVTAEPGVYKQCIGLLLWRVVQFELSSRMNPDCVQACVLSINEMDGFFGRGGC